MHFSNSLCIDPEMCRIVEGIARAPGEEDGTLFVCRRVTPLTAAERDLVFYVDLTSLVSPDASIII